MVSPLYRSWSRVLGDEDSGEEQDDAVSSTAGESASETEPDYSFEGYSVEFIDKVALLPATQTPASTAHSRRRG